MPARKNIKFYIKYFVGPVLFAWLLFSIYRQVTAQTHLSESWLHIQNAFTSSRIWLLAGIIALMPLNWGIEALKWQRSVVAVQKISFWSAFKAVLTGVSFSVTMPNRVGEYLGRILYLQDGKRLKVISLTLICSVSQLLVTLFAGIVGCIALKQVLLQSGIVSAIGYRFALFSLVGVSGILTLLYFGVRTIESLLERWVPGNKYLYLVEAVQGIGMQRLWNLLLLSFCRYSVFMLQYILAFRFFSVNVSLLWVFWLMSLVFLALAIVPSIVLLEVGIRGQVSIWLFGLFTANKLGVLLASVTIWSINLMLPALAGSIFLLGINILKRKNENA